MLLSRFLRQHLFVLVISRLSASWSRSHKGSGAMKKILIIGIAVAIATAAWLALILGAEAEIGEASHAAAQPCSEAPCAIILF